MRTKPRDGGLSAPCALWACIGEDGRYYWAWGIRYWWWRRSDPDGEYGGDYRKLAIRNSLVVAGAAFKSARILTCA